MNNYFDHNPHENPIPKPRFTGIFIPVEILDYPHISNLEKMLLPWVDALYDRRRGGCVASNRYLADCLGVKPNTISKAISRLTELDLIEYVSEKWESNRVIRAKMEVSR